ncbi:hypothetical protein SAMN05444422_109219 [Halobiforma haloterrestris]|uniref:Uncharacterized protein n=1 Tax=Natronobacterium haloterrestre TaxID=148448 RepID=A0A1I1K2R9_NATHA|nr:hypothetical protein [Halobiforma haloterrestris]SFC52283.1 hypothetical protein SAMN05444422_109219 [Halobiforma haloterrestris]
MCAPFTAHDVGKPVENEEGEDVGVVVSVADGVAYVLPSADANAGDSAAADRPRRLDPDSVRAITEEAVRLAGDLPAEDEAIDAERNRGLEADPSELSPDDGGPVTPDEFAVEPDEDMEPTDAAVDPDAEQRPTDDEDGTENDAQ